MCYKDKTWCNFYKDCVDSKKCHRVLTDKEKLQAIKWWGSEDFLICYLTDKPKCFNNGVSNNNNNEGTS